MSSITRPPQPFDETETLYAIEETLKNKCYSEIFKILMKHFKEKPFITKNELLKKTKENGCFIIHQSRAHQLLETFVILDMLLKQGKILRQNKYQKINDNLWSHATEVLNGNPPKN